MAPAIMKHLGEMPYSLIDAVHQDPPQPVPFREASALLPALSAEAVEALLAIAGPGADCPLLMVELRLLGGALARPPAFPDAIDARNDACAVFMVGLMMPPLAEKVPGALARAQQALSPFSGARTFVNVHGAPGSAEDLARPWIPETAEWLRSTKATSDPAGRFVFAHRLG
ncbi:MAG: hypothetical protein ACRDJU_12570 [Actinomycetota bacterium]